MSAKKEPWLDIYKNLKEKIENCEIRPDEVLITEDLAKRFKVSRTPVREALLALRKDGLLIPHRRVGFIVSSVDIREVVETYHLRLVLEREAVMLAARHVTETELEALRQSISPEHPPQTANQKFHCLIAKFSRGKLLEDFITTLIGKSRRAASFDPLISDPNEKANVSHAEILKALERHDADESCRIMTEHILNARQRVLHLLSGPGLPSFSSGVSEAAATG